LLRPKIAGRRQRFGDPSACCPAGPLPLLAALPPEGSDGGGLFAALPRCARRHHTAAGHRPSSTG